MQAKKFLINRLLFFTLLALIFFFPEPLAASQQKPQNQTCAVYLTGIGCPACARIEPLILSELLSEIPGLVIIEYEIYRKRQENQKISQNYFSSFLRPEAQSGIPSLILGKNTYVGAVAIRDAAGKIRKETFPECPMPDKSLMPLEEFIASRLPGRPRIWTKNRVFILEPKSPDAPLDTRTRDACMRALIQAEDITSLLQNISFNEISPKPVETSRGMIKFQNAVMVGNWRVQWDGTPPPDKPISPFSPESLSRNWLPLLLAFIIGILLALLITKGEKIANSLKIRKKDFFLICTTVAALGIFFLIALNTDSLLLKNLGYRLPLPLFTFIVALIDGFNPCNMFVLTVLLALLISSSASRRRFYLIGFIFTLIVFAFYFLFMIAWLNVFKYIGFAGPLRILIAAIALCAGLINCKEFFFFKKGPSLMIAEKHKGLLYAKMRKLTDIVNKGSLPLLISSSVTLAIFSSLIEIPCTAGFPIIYTHILSVQVEAGGLGYILYLIFYNLIYVIPLVTIIAIFGFTFEARKVSERQIQTMKLIGGIIMIFLGIILLANPRLIGAAI